MLSEGQSFNTKITPTKEEEQEYLAYDRPEKFFENLEGGLSSLDTLKENSGIKSPVLICGGMAAFDKGILDFLNAWSRKEKDLFLLSEVTAQYRRYTNEKIEFAHICTPHLLAKEMVLRDMEIETSSEMLRLPRKKRYVHEAVQNTKMRYGTLGRGYAEAWCWYAYQYIIKLLDILEPRKVILWNEFYAFHHIFQGICLEKEIPLEYMEFGCIPGTFVIEKNGQQGESLIASDPEKFKCLPVSAAEEEQAGKVINYLCEAGLNRNPQPENVFIKKMISGYKPGRPIVTYMGQNDFESGFYPYTKRTRKFHSPVFKNTLDALEYLSRLAVKNGWNLVYKPHPIMKSLGHAGSPEQMELFRAAQVGDTDINSLIDESDVVVTILSQSAYIALIRGKPVVMLGYTQLRGKGCTYEAFGRRVIEGTIKSAVKKENFSEHLKNFRRHVACILKYYLYDDMTQRSLRFGRKL